MLGKQVEESLLDGLEIVTLLDPRLLALHYLADLLVVGYCYSLDLHNRRHELDQLSHHFLQLWTALVSVEVPAH